MELCLSSIVPVDTLTRMPHCMVSRQVSSQYAGDYKVVEEVLCGLLKRWAQQLADSAHELWARMLHSSREPQFTLGLQAPVKQVLTEGL